MPQLKNCSDVTDRLYQRRRNLLGFNEAALRCQSDHIKVGRGPVYQSEQQQTTATNDQDAVRQSAAFKDSAQSL